MRLLHAADLHIGFRAYSRSTPTGLNQREADVARTLSAMVDQMIALKPDAIVIAGDVFHVPRPSNAAILTAFRAFARLADELPQCAIVMIAGDWHDTPRSGESTGILQLFAPLGIQVADRESVRYAFSGHGLSVLAVPGVPSLERPVIAPDPDARFNVLVTHGDAQGVKQGGADRRPSLARISAEELNLAAWDYVALGHYHQHEQLASNVAYSGSIDFTSSNVWAEIATPKGFIERDLATGEQTFHELPRSRPVIDCPAISGHGQTPAELDAAIRDALANVPDGAIVRVVVHGVSLEVARALDQKALRSYRNRFVHFNLDARRPLPKEYAGQELSAEEGGRVRRKSVFAEWDAKVAAFDLPADVDRAEFAAVGRKYLDLATADDTPADADHTNTLEQQLHDSLEINKNLKRSA